MCIDIPTYALTFHMRSDIFELALTRGIDIFECALAFPWYMPIVRTPVHMRESIADNQLRVSCTNSALWLLNDGKLKVARREEDGTTKYSGNIAWLAREKVYCLTNHCHNTHVC